MKRPNILFIMSDDHGYWALGKGCGGLDTLRTPNLDRIASEGMKLENCFCASPVCSPARASIMTGTIPSAHGIQDWLLGGSVDLDRCPYLRGTPEYANEGKAIRYLDGKTCFTDLLAAAGYDIALSGKWHLGDSLNPQHGYSRWYTIGRGGCHYMRPDMVDDGRVTFEDRYVTDLITERALVYLDELADGYKNNDRPFMLDVRYTAPHAPWNKEQHPKEIFDTYADHDFSELPDVEAHEWNYPAAVVHHGEKRRELLAGYYSAITAMDIGIGQLLDRLDELGLADDTIVIFTGDNGMSMGHHGIWGKGNGTFPQNMYDTAVKVPFLARYPGVIPAGTRNDGLFSHYDIMPTIVELCGLDKPAEHLPGHSMLGALKGEDSGEDDRAAVVFDEYGPVRMIRTREWKLVRRYPYGPNELYDIVNDPNEDNNLYDDPAYKAKKDELAVRMEKWFYDYVDPAIDASKQPVTGYGQKCRSGIYADGECAFGGQEEIKKLMADRRAQGK